jgi:hypothetical protein
VRARERVERESRKRESREGVEKERERVERESRKREREMVEVEFFLFFFSSK